MSTPPDKFKDLDLILDLIYERSNFIEYHKLLLLKEIRDLLSLLLMK